MDFPAKTPMDDFFENVYGLDEFLVSCKACGAVQEDDNKEYTQFLGTTLIGIGEGEPKFNSDNQRDNQSGLADYNRELYRTIEKIYNKQSKENILTQGVRHCSQGGWLNQKSTMLTPSNSTVPDAPSLEFTTINSGIEQLKGKCWKKIYERVGAPLIHAIQHHSIFISMKDDNLIQIAGKPLDKVTLEKKRYLKDLKSGYRYNLKLKPHHIYATELREGFSKTFIPKVPQPEPVQQVLKNILENNVMDYKPVKKGNIETDNHEQLLAWLGLFLQKHTKMEKKLKFLVRSRFPIEGLEKLSTEALVQSYQTEQKVYSFIARCLYGVVPIELLGTSDNLNTFLRNFHVMLTRKRFEQFLLGELLKGIKVSKIYWTRQYATEEQKTSMVAKVVRWLLHYCMAIIKGYFYVTDTSIRSIPGVYVYYRKPIWAELIRRGVRDCNERGLIMPASKCARQKESLGTSCVRFLPKQNSVRPVQMMGKKVNKVSLNMKLGCVKDAIGWVLANDQSTPHQAFAEFAEKIASVNPRPKLYYVNLDIKNCYDNLDAADLLATVTDNLKDVPKQTLFTRKVAITRLHRGTSNIHRKMFSEEEYCGIKGYTASLVRQRQLKNVVFVDKMLNQPKNTNDLCRLLDRHLYSNHIKFYPNGREYVQTGGVSQGSVAAGNLCEISFKKLEKEFSFKEDEYYMRHVDDVLFVSPSRSRIRRLFNLFHNKKTGQGSGRVSVNLGKSSTNCQGLPIEYIDNDFVISLGIVFDLKTLTVQPHFDALSIDRYTVTSQQNPGKVIKTKLINIMSNKTKAVYYQPKLNTVGMIIGKVYATFSCLVILWKGLNKKLAFRIERNTKYSIGLMRSLYHLFYTQVNNRLKKVNFGELPMSKDQVGWVCVRAFREGLKTSCCPSFFRLVKREECILRKKMEEAQRVQPDLGLDLLDRVLKMKTRRK